MYAYKSKLLVRNLAMSLIAEGHPVFQCILDLPEDDLRRALQEVNRQRLFNDITRIVLKKCYDNTFNKSTTSSTRYKSLITDDQLAARRTSVFYELTTVLALHYFNLAINHFSYETFNHDDIAKILRRHLRSGAQHVFNPGNW